jgi:hypothetical protein
MKTLPAALLATALLSGCHSYQPLYEDEVTYYDADTYEDTEQPSYEDSSVYTEEDASWYDGSSVVSVSEDGYDAAPVYYNSYNTAPMYNPRPYLSVPSVPVPPPFYPPSSYRPSRFTARPNVTMPTWNYAVPSSSATIRVPPPVLIWPVRICPY